MAGHEIYMHRCIELAQKGKGQVAPNPMVGSVLVYNNRIIGEGWHKKYGEAHAEVNCLQSVSHEDVHLIPESTLYVSLEPCSHHGKTPPCADLIIKYGIKKVVIGCEDPFPKVNGSGIQKLKEHGVEVLCGVLEHLCKKENRRFITFHQERRPYVILKWAQSADGFTGTGTSDRALISNKVTNKLVHRWRAEESAILIGTNTALLDNPMLTARWGNQPQPVRILLDRSLKLKKDLQVFSQPGGKVMVFNSMYEKEEEGISYVLLQQELPVAQAILKACFKMNLQSILIEGGQQLLQSFIDEGIWDEARVITGADIYLKSGIRSPQLHHAQIKDEYYLLNDHICYYELKA
jgi:diaminohydroxyphosphoribosylaminopyrimidine deaminase/5-amino-6-(5-phosphoribosylamino)uracil reductase